MNSTPRSQPPEFSWARVVFLLACLVLNACSQASKRAADATSNRGSAESTQATPASPASTASPTPEIEPLKVPERVAAGEVTEQGGPWNRAVQRITYLSTADKTRQPMMFYKPKRDEPRPLLVGLHSSSNTRSVDGNIAAAEFMNEPTLAAMGGAPAGYDAAAYGRDFKVFHVFAKQGAPDMLHLPLSRSMGRLAKQEVHVVARNTLVASDYGLLDDETLTPKPNYWGALLWRKLMGTTVLESGIPLQTGQV